MLLFMTPCQASPEEYQIWYREQYNDDGTALMTIWLYKVAEAVPDYDFYVIKIRITGMKSSGSFYVRTDIFSNGVCNDWEPKTDVYWFDTHVSITIVEGVGFGIDIPAGSVGTTEGLMPTFGWKCREMLDSSAKEFVSSWYVPDGVDFGFMVQSSEWFEPLHSPDICFDLIQVYYPYVFDFMTLEIQEDNHGTTHPIPGTYEYYPEGFTASVWACPYTGYLFDYWEVSEYGPGSGVGCYEYDNPVMQTMDDDYSVEPFFAYDVYVPAQDQKSKWLTTGDVYIDGQLVGYTGSHFPVAKGTHTFFVNDFWDQERTGNRYTFQRWEDYSTTNPRTEHIKAAKTIKAYFQKTYCPGDCNGDGVCDFFDVTFVSIHFGSKRDIGDPYPTGNNWDSRADTVQSGSSYDCIDIFDLNEVIKYSS